MKMVEEIVIRDVEHLREIERFLAGTGNEVDSNDLYDHFNLSEDSDVVEEDYCPDMEENKVAAIFYKHPSKMQSLSDSRDEHHSDQVDIPSNTQ